MVCVAEPFLVVNCEGWPRLSTPAALCKPNAKQVVTVSHPNYTTTLSFSAEGIPMKGVEKNEQRFGLDVQPILDNVQQQWVGFSRWLGPTIEEGKGKLNQHMVWCVRTLGLERNKRDNVEGKCKLGSLTETLEESRSFVVHCVSRFTRHQRLVGGPFFASLSSSSPCQPQPLFNLAMSMDQVSRKLDGVPVYTVSNSANEFILISDSNSQKSLGIFCFRYEDAESLLSQVRDREPLLGRGARVVAVSLDKVYQLNTEGIAFRFLPDPRQVKNAIDAKSKAGDTEKAFDGVPIFQSDNLILRSNNRRFCPIFFCKEDLEKALTRAFKQQQRVNPSLRVATDIQVGSFEDVLKRMETSDGDTGWGDVIFIPPGIDAFSHLGKALAQGFDGSIVT